MIAGIANRDLRPRGLIVSAQDQNEIGSDNEQQPVVGTSIERQILDLLFAAHSRGLTINVS